ncbi:MAG: wbuZ [Bacteroidetes bacterium]|jgi:cyclase|nr:wbuZ [Bacteroidota bacterium]
MLQTRVIPCLLLKDDGLVKTVQFKNSAYVGDPINTVRIFNEKEVDELIFLDIQASPLHKEPDFKLLAEIANECFMPLAYGGGLRNIEQVKRIFNIGIEKVAINTHAHENPAFVTEIAELYGSQAVIASIDVKKNFWKKAEVVSSSASKKHKYSPVEWAKEMQERGAGEILLTSVDKEGTWDGYDLDLIKSVTSVVDIPVIAHGGAGMLSDFTAAKKTANASAMGIGSMVVYQKKDMGVLINFPDRKKLEAALN